MAQTDTVFAGSIPAFYCRYLGPLFFEPYAEDLARRLANIRRGRILETAAGTGVVTRSLVRTLPEAVSIVATDLNQPMLDFAAARTGTTRITWQRADAGALPFEDKAFDAVVCQFGVMFFSDKVAAYREARGVLKAGGRFLFSVWDRLEENEISRIVSETVTALFPEDPPRFLARTPYAYHDIGILGDELARAGFSSINSETVQRFAVAPTPRDAVIGLVQGSPLRNEIEAPDASRLDVATDAAVSAVAAQFGSGPMSTKMQAHVIIAVN